MKILVANLGSTSFKYRLFDLPESRGAVGGRELARGGVERIGAAESRVYASTSAGGEPTKLEAVMPVPDHAVALKAAFDQLTAPGGPLASVEEVAEVYATEPELMLLLIRQMVAACRVAAGMRNTDFNFPTEVEEVESHQGSGGDNEEI
jgi:hypothetical protein